MATTKSRPSSPRAGGGKRGAPPRQQRTPVIGFAIGVVVVLAVVTVVASRGSTPKTGEVKGLRQTRPVAVSGTPLPQLSGAGADSAVGTPAPRLRGSTFAGRPVAIVDDGRPELVLFVAHWCPHCQREVPVLASWLRSRGKPAGVDLYAVATGTTPDRPNYPPSAWLQRPANLIKVLGWWARGRKANAAAYPPKPGPGREEMMRALALDPAADIARLAAA